jgi:glutaminase
MRRRIELFGPSILAIVGLVMWWWFLRSTLAAMLTCGMYDHSGNWVYDIGVPAKSGVGGGIVG